MQAHRWLTGRLDRPPRNSPPSPHSSGYDAGYALNVDLDPARSPVVTACGLEDTAFTTVARELGRPVAVDELRPHAAAALEDVFDLALTEPRLSGLEELRVLDGRDERVDDNRVELRS